MFAFDNFYKIYSHFLSSLVWYSILLVCLNQYFHFIYNIHCHLTMQINNDLTEYDKNVYVKISKEKEKDDPKTKKKCVNANYILIINFIFLI